MAPLWIVTLLVALIPFQVVIFELLFRTNARTDVVTAPAPLIVRLLLTVTTPLARIIHTPMELSVSDSV
jgi:hypothetical protein